MSILKPDLDQYGFKTLDDYFNYMVESQINGQFQQVKSLAEALSRKQKKEALIYFLNRQHVRDDYELRVIFVIIDSV